jgi:hypothetical protein
MRVGINWLNYDGRGGECQIWGEVDVFWGLAYGYLQ